MKATCPRCGTKAAHEMVVSVVRTWFRCVNCNFVWRGTLFSLAFASVPLGSAFREEDATVPLQIPPEGTVVIDELTPPPSLPGPPARAGVQTAEAPPAEPSEMETEAPAPVRMGSARPLQDVESWLDSVQDDVTPVEAKPGPTTPADGVPEVEELDPEPESEPQPTAPHVELGGWLEQVDEDLPTAEPPANRLRREARAEPAGRDETPSPPRLPTAVGSEPFEEQLTIEELEAMPPPAAAPEVASEPQVVSVPEAASEKVAAETRADSPAPAAPSALSHLDELLKDLEVLEEGLTEMEQRLTKPSLHGKR